MRGEPKKKIDGSDAFNALGIDRTAHSWGLGPTPSLNSEWDPTRWSFMFTPPSELKPLAIFQCVTTARIRQES